MSVVPPNQYSYTNDESLEMVIHSIRGNQQCKQERKAFNLCRSTVLGKFVEPEFCQDKAMTFINCFQKVRRDETTDCKDKYATTLSCAQKNSGSWFSLGSPCQSQLSAYVGCQ